MLRILGVGSVSSCVGGYPYEPRVWREAPDPRLCPVVPSEAGIQNPVYSHHVYRQGIAGDARLEVRVWVIYFKGDAGVGLGC